MKDIRYTLFFVVYVLAVLLAFRQVFPYNHAYASLAAFFSVFIYAFYLGASVGKALLCYLAFLTVLLLDSFSQTWLITQVKSSESLIFPVVSSLVMVAPILIITLANKMRRYFRGEAGEDR